MQAAIVKAESMQPKIVPKMRNLATRKSVGKRPYKNQ
jgi:hypothetical protein